VLLKRKRKIFYFAQAWIIDNFRNQCYHIAMQFPAKHNLAVQRQHRQLQISMIKL